MKKLLTLIVSLILAMACLGGFTACGEKNEKIKIAVVQGDPSEAQQKLIDDYLKNTFAKNYDIEFIFSENLSNSSDELNFLENVAARGCKGVLSFVTNSTNETWGSKCSELGLFWTVLGNPTKEQVSAWKDNRYFLGGIGQQSEEVAGMKAMTLSLLNQKGGNVKLLALTGGVFTNNAMFVDRRKGITDAISEYQTQTSNTVTFSEVDGFPGSAWFASVGTELAKKPDIVISCAASSVALSQIKSVKETDSNWNPLFGANGSTDAELLSAVPNDINYLEAINPQIVAIDVVLIANSIKKGASFVPEDEGFAKFSISYMAITTAEQAENAANNLFTKETLDSIMYEKNADVTFENVTEVVNALNA